MLYRISVTERGLTGIANIFRSRLSRLDDLLGAGTVPLSSSGRTITFTPAFYLFVEAFESATALFVSLVKKTLKHHSENIKDR